MVTGSSASQRVATALALTAGSIYLMVLPVGHMTAVRSLASVVLLATALWLWCTPNRRLLPLFGAFAVWVVAAALSLLTSRDFDASLRGIENDVLRSIIVFMCFYVLTRRLAAYHTWVMATALGFALLSALAIYSFYIHGEWHSHYVPVLQDYATSAITILPLLLGYFAFSRGRPGGTAIVALGIGLTLVASFLTMSRAVWLVLICAITFFVFWRGLVAARFDRRSALVVALVWVAGLALGAIVASQRGTTLLRIHDRMEFYSLVVAKLQERPITGMGYGHELDRAWYEALLPGTSMHHPHNIVLSYVEQMGLLGGIAILLLFAVPAWVFARNLKVPSPQGSLAAACGIVLLLSVFLKNSFDYFFWKHNLWLFFAHLGIYFGEIDRTLQQPERSG